MSPRINKAPRPSSRRDRVGQPHRGGNDPKYNNVRWATLSRAIRTREPLCRVCSRDNRVTGARLVDHIRPDRLFDIDFYDQNNLQPMCNSCHAKKSQMESLCHDQAEFNKRLLGTQYVPI